MSKILYLEDSVFQFRLVSQWLTGLHELVQAVSVNDAQEMILESLGRKEEKFALFICDYFLPDGTCLDFVRHLKKYPQYHNTPVILISKGLDEHMLAEAIRSGVNDCVRKPVRPVEFLSLIDRMLSNPYVRGLDAHTETITCISWREGKGYFQYCPNFCKQFEGVSASEASEKMRIFLENQLSGNASLSHLEEVSLIQYDVEMKEK